MEETTQLDLGSLGSFDFTPEWAKQDAGVTVGKTHAAPEKKPFEREKKSFGNKKPFVRPNFERKPRFEERPKPLDAEIKILPETKALGTIIRKLQQDTHAYKLKDLAYFFLDNPASVLLKVQPKDETKFHQCKACGFAAVKQEDLIEHLLSVHLPDYYEAKEIDCEPPKGNFTCVAKCGLSGVLLGPPNVHGFNAKVKEMLRTKYPNMSEADYRSHIEMVRDTDSIEAWRQSAVKKTVYLAKGAGESAAHLTREQAESEFKRNVLASMMDVPKALMITAEQALKSPVKALQWAVKDALELERRNPQSMCFALRGAFHHRKMKFFRANDARGSEFVTNVEYKSFDAAHAIPELAKIATFVAEHPCQPKSVIAPDAETEKHLAWLVSTGHIVSFTNGVYSPVEKYPKYGPQWQKKIEKPAEKPAEKKEEVKDEVAPELAQ